jgi:hypothetical protein
MINEIYDFFFPKPKLVDKFTNTPITFEETYYTELYLKKKNNISLTPEETYDLSMVLDKKYDPTEVMKYNSLWEQHKLNYPLIEPDTNFIHEFRKKYYQLRFGVAINNYGDGKFRPKTNDITLEIYNKRFEMVQEGFLLDHLEKLEMHHFYKTYNNNREGLTGELMKLIAWTPGCLRDYPNYQLDYYISNGLDNPSSKYICWLCGKKHMNDRLS